MLKTRDHYAAHSVYDLRRALRSAEERAGRAETEEACMIDMYAIQEMRAALIAKGVEDATV